MPSSHRHTLDHNQRLFSESSGSGSTHQPPSQHAERIENTSDLKLSDTLMCLGDADGWTACVIGPEYRQNSASCRFFFF